MPGSSGSAGDRVRSGRDRMCADVPRCTRIAAQEPELCHFTSAGLPAPNAGVGAMGGKAGVAGPASASGEYGVSWLSLCEPCLRAGGGNPPMAPVWLHCPCRKRLRSRQDCPSTQVQQSADVAGTPHGSSARRPAFTRGRPSWRSSASIIPSAPVICSRAAPPLLSDQVAALLTAVVIEHARECPSAGG